MAVLAELRYFFFLYFEKAFFQREVTRGYCTHATLDPTPQTDSTRCSAPLVPGLVRSLARRTRATVGRGRVGPRVHRGTSAPPTSSESLLSRCVLSPTTLLIHALLSFSYILLSLSSSSEPDSSCSTPTLHAMLHARTEGAS